MDEGKLRPVFADQIAECDWSSGVTKDELLSVLDGYPAFREMVIQFVADDRYSSPDAVMAVIPEQAWQDVQGGVWRGGETGDPVAMNSHFQDGPVGQDSGEVYRAGAETPPTPGFGHVQADESGQSGGAV